MTGTSDIVATTNEIQAYLQSNADVDGVLALNAGIAELALRAIRGAGSDAVVGTFDVSDTILEAIEAGDVLFAVDQQAYLQGFLPIAFAYFSQLPEVRRRWGFCGRCGVGRRRVGW